MPYYIECCWYCNTNPLDRERFDHLCLKCREAGRRAPFPWLSCIVTVLVFGAIFFWLWSSPTGHIK